MVLSSDEVEYVVSNNSTYITEASVRFNFYSPSFEYGIETYLIYIVLLASFCILSRMGLFVRSLFRTNFVVKTVCWVFDEGCFFMLKDLFAVCKLKEKNLNLAGLSFLQNVELTWLGFLLRGEAVMFLISRMRSVFFSLMNP